MASCCPPEGFIWNLICIENGAVSGSLTYGCKNGVGPGSFSGLMDDYEFSSPVDVGNERSWESKDNKCTVKLVLAREA